MNICEEAKRLYIPRLMQLRESKRAVTNSLREDGFCSQYQDLMACLMYADLAEVEFHYTPIQVMDHNYDKDPNFIRNKELCMNFTDKFKKADGTELKLTQHQAVFALNPDRLFACKTVNFLRKCFFKDKKRPSYYEDDKVNIGYHIRRKLPVDMNDVNDVNRKNVWDAEDNNFEYLPYFLKMYPDSILHIFCHGQEETFQRYIDLDPERVRLHLNETIEQVLTSLSFAEIQIVSCSAIPYMAAILAEDQEVYTDILWTYMTPKSSWKPIPLIKTFAET